MSQEMTRHKGVGASPGIALGYAHVLDQGKITIPRKSILREEVEKEVSRFDETLEVVREQLQSLRKRVSEEQGEEHVYLIEAQLYMLEDKSLIDDTRELIRSQKINVEWALQRAMDRFKSLFDKIDDEYFRDRRSDIEYVEERLLRALAGKKEHGFLSIQGKTIIVAQDMAPADLAKLNRENLCAIVTDMGGRTSHIAIIARSLEIPFVTGAGDLSFCVQSGVRMIVDANEGVILAQPDAKTWSQYEEKQRQYVVSRGELLKNREHKAETKDQYTIHLQANVDLLEELPSVLSNGAEGIGMLRTEHVFLGGSIPVSEEQQLTRYRTAVEKIKPNETVIRLLDLPGDELFHPPTASSFHRNPALGLRGIRFLLQEKEILCSQIRAILRASAFGKVAILYPMISSVEEVRQTNQALSQMMEELKNEKIEFDADLRIGAMIEIPSAALTAELIAQEVDFLSIGTNDLIQYTLGVDRTSELVADLYDPYHSAVIQLIKMVVEKGHKAGIEVGVCGEVACDPLFIPLLVAMECNFLSMNAAAIPLVKQIVRELSMTEAKKWLTEIGTMQNPAEVRHFLSSHLSERFRGIPS